MQASPSNLAATEQPLTSSLLETSESGVVWHRRYTVMGEVLRDPDSRDELEGYGKANRTRHASAELYLPYDYNCSRRTMADPIDSAL